MRISLLRRKEVGEKIGWILMKRKDITQALEISLAVAYSPVIGAFSLTREKHERIKHFQNFDGWLMNDSDDCEGMLQTHASESFNHDACI